MKIHNVAQGTPEWLALRGDHFTASEAPAMMGASKYQTRTELLAAKKSGIAPEITSSQQFIFDKGHAAEAAARPIIEARIGEELYPIVATEGALLASLDGATMTGELIFEHKLWNADLAAKVSRGELDPHYYWQLEQQLLVSGAEECLFVVSDGTEANMVVMSYKPHPGRREQLLAGWAQFEQDLAEFVPAEAAPMVVAGLVDDLPTISVKVSGQLALVDNFNVFEAALTSFLADRLIRDPRSDQDFADLDMQIKALKKAEAALDAAEAQMIAQVETVATAQRRKDALAKLTRDNRLMAEKLLAAKKESVRLEILQAGKTALDEHIATINKRLGSVQLPPIAADFAGVIKGKRTIVSLQDAIATELARAKIEANAIAEAIEVNLASLRELADNHRFLFGDRQQLVLKANDDLIAVIKSRISEHEAGQAKKLEAQREQIRLEELAKIEREASLAASPPEPAQVEPVAASILAPARTAAGSAQAGAESVHVASKRQPSAARPTDDEILGVLAMHYRVHESKIIEWIITMDMESAARRSLEAV